MLACVENSVVFPFQHNYHAIEDEVTFGNLKQYYRPNETIVVEYTLGQNVRASSHDIVGMYPVGWNSLEQFVAFEAPVVRPAETYRRQRKVVFQPRHRVQRIHHGIEYMFVYVSKDSMVLGTSSTFMFIPEMLPENQPECWKGCDEKLLKTGRPLRKAPDGHSLPFFMDNLPLSQQYSSCVMAPPWIQQPQLHHNMGGTASLLPVCVQCKCPANYARTQQNLQAKVRAVTDELHDERARSAGLERQLELSRAAQAKLRLSAQYANREKNLALAYLNNLIGSLSERGILKMIHQTTGPDQRQRYCPQRPPVAQKIVQHPPDASNPNTLPSPRPGLLTARERLLKAIIGSQEATIRDLVRRLNLADAETKTTKELEVQKMKILGRNTDATGDSSGSKSAQVQKLANLEKLAKVDTVQSVVIDAQEAQFGDREVLPDSDDSDGNESYGSVNNEGVFEKHINVIQEVIQYPVTVLITANKMKQ